MTRTQLLGASTMVLASLAFVAPASAQDPGTSFYGAIGYSFVTADADGDDVTLGALGGKLGLRFMQYFGVEGEAQFGVSGDSVSCSGCTGDIDVDLKHDYGIYAIGFLPLNPNFDLFARIGYGSAEVEASVGSVSVSDDDDSIRWGAGGQFFFDGVNGIRAEYTNSGNLDDSDAEFDAFTISYTRRF